MNFLIEIKILFFSLMVGVLIVPMCIYPVGAIIIGSFEGGGIRQFFGSYLLAILEFRFGALFLAFSPYLLWSCYRAYNNINE